jgi:hypothetical protein
MDGPSADVSGIINKEGLRRVERTEIHIEEEAISPGYCGTFHRVKAGDW